MFQSKMMLRYIFLFFAFVIPIQGHAQDNSEVKVNKKSAEELIETLESESAREDFIQNLKTLIEANEEDDDSIQKTIPAISKTLGIENQTSEFIKGYSQFLEKNNLNSSSIGKIGLSLGAVLVFLFVAYLIKKLTFALRKKLSSLKQKYDLTHSRFNTYVRVIRYGLNIILSLLFLYSMALIWSIADIGFMRGELTLILLGSTVNLLSIVVITVILWEAVNGFIEYAVRKSGAKNSARVKTILPIARKILLMIFIAFFGLMLLSELGLNIMPFLAGAGVLGIAVGFGAQSMVKDFLTGFVIIMEDLIQVGDVVTLSERSGLVEKITIRKVQLRGLDGTVYTVPFSEINIVENMTKYFSYYLMDIGIAYREETDEVIGYLSEIDEGMRNAEEYKDLILAPIEILGVDHFADSAVIIKARVKTRPGKQWAVGREFNRRMKQVFDKNKVEMPFPHQTIYFGEDKKGHAPPAPILVKDKENSKKLD